MSGARRHLAAAIVRRKIRARRRRRLLLAGGAALTIAVSSALSLASFAGVDVAEAAVQRAKSFLDLIRQRSPGTRTEAQLTKFRKVHRVLAERQPEPAIVVPTYVPDVGLTQPPLLVPAAYYPEAPVLVAGKPLGPVFQVPPIGGIYSPPPGGGGGGPPQAPPPPPPPFLPEPGTWAMLIAGFGLTGWIIRRDRNAARLSHG